MNEKVTDEIKDFSEKMHELEQKVHAMNVKRSESPAIYSSEDLCELLKLRVYTRNNDYILNGVRVVFGYNKEIPNELCLRVFVIDKEKPGAEWYVNIFRGSMCDIEEYLKDESNYPKIRGYLSILHERMIQGD